MAERRKLDTRTMALWTVEILAGTLLVLFVLVLGPWLLTQQPQRNLTAEQELKAKNDVRTTLVQALAGLAVAGGLVITYRTYRQNRLEQDRTYDRELYAKAVEQLGHDHAPVRLGALYSLESLAQGQPHRRQAIVDVFCAYLRMPYALPAGSNTPTDGEHVQQAHDSAQELQVRQTVQRLLAAHLIRPDDASPEETQQRPSSPDENFWPRISIDLTGATLVQLDLTKASVVQASLVGATFAGDASFAYATFAGNASFGGATFTGRVEFGGATFAGNTSFDGAKFAGDAAFINATFAHLSFTGATFERSAWFGYATFTGDAGFNGVTINGDASFDGATFTFDAGFFEASFARDASFGGATFGRSVWFNKAAFTLARFGGATFAGDAQFDETTFTDHAEFDRASVLHLDDPGLLGVRTWPDGFIVRPDPVNPTHGEVIRA